MADGIVLALVAVLLAVCIWAFFTRSLGAKILSGFANPPAPSAGQTAAENAQIEGKYGSAGLELWGAYKKGMEAYPGYGNDMITTQMNLKRTSPGSCPGLALVAYNGCYECPDQKKCYATFNAAVAMSNDGVIKWPVFKRRLLMVAS